MSATQQTNAALIAEARAELHELEGVLNHTYALKLMTALEGTEAKLTDLQAVADGMAALEVEAARWREVAGELAGELARAFSINWKDAPDEAMDISQSVRRALHNYRHTLTTYQQVRGE